jgi:hypothetical protein
VLRYGLGVGYDLYESPDCCRPWKVAGVFEVVGWSVVDGFKAGAQSDVVLDADDDTIVNGKYGLRLTAGPNTVYAGYGNSWSNDRWYREIFRLEVGRNF